MDQETNPPDHPSVPPPDLPKPHIPEPPAVESSAPDAPAVQVTVREPGETETPAGGLAPFNTRILAALIDVVVSIGLQIAAMLVLPSFADRLAWVLGFGYLVARDSLPFLGGQSVGKKAMKLKAVTLEGKPLVNLWEPSIIRNIVLLIPFFALIELVVLLTREGKPEQGRRLGDEWAKTKVIPAPEPSPGAPD